MSGAALAQPARRERSDEELVAAVRCGDDQAFELLYKRYRPRIAAYVLGTVRDRGRAEDVTQEVFLSAVRRMRETVRPIAFRPWIYEIARNACIDQFRHRRREEALWAAIPEAESNGRPRLSVVADPPDEAAHARERLDQLCRAMEGLPESHREVLVLRELEGRSYREIAKRMGLTRPAVESTLFRARRRLAEEFDELASGRRCQRVQETLELAAQRALRIRDRPALGRHVSHCYACRRRAHELGVEDVLVDRRGVLARLGAFLPFLPRRSHGAGHGPAHWTPALGSLGEPAVAAAKVIAAAAAIAVAGLGVGVAEHTLRAPTYRVDRPGQAARPDRTGPVAALGTDDSAGPEHGANAPAPAEPSGSVDSESVDGERSPSAGPSRGGVSGAEDPRSAPQSAPAQPRVTPPVAPGDAVPSPPQPALPPPPAGVEPPSVPATPPSVEPVPWPENLPSAGDLPEPDLDAHRARPDLERPGRRRGGIGLDGR